MFCNPWEAVIKTARRKTVHTRQKKSVKEAKSQQSKGRRISTDRRQLARRHDDPPTKRNGSRKRKISELEQQFLKERKERGEKPCGPYELTRHHRLAKCNGGTFSEENISYVLEYLHKAWHKIFKTFPPLKVGEIFHKRAMLLGFDRNALSRVQLRKLKRLTDKKPSFEEEVEAWYKLYGGKTYETALEETNSIWISPASRLVFKASIILVLVRKGATKK